MQSPDGSIDSVDGALAIESRFQWLFFRAVLAVTLLVLALHPGLGLPAWPAAAMAVIGLAMVIGAVVEWRGRRPLPAAGPLAGLPPPMLGVAVLGVASTAYLAAVVAAQGTSPLSPAVWWLTVFPCCVILTGAWRTGVVLLAGSLLALLAVHAGLVPAAPPAGRPPATATASLLAAAGSSSVLGLFLVLSVQRRLALRQALLAAITRLAAERERARAENNAKDLLLANTTHELRTPLNAVIGLAELLATARLSPAQERELLGQMHQSAAMLRELADDVLDYAKLEAGRLAVEQVEFPLRTTVFGIAHLFAPQAHGKGLEIGVCLTPDTPHRVAGDPLRLRQILANFVANAIRFTDHGGVQLCIRTLPGDGIRIEVHDSGIGISQADLAGLFQPFVQASAATARRYGGSGLGLSICRQLAERMGGRVGATSTPGQGSVFWVELPLPARPGDSPFAYPELPPMGGLLLVTGNRFLHWTVSDMMKSRQLDVRLVPDLDDPALDDLPAHSVVLVDAQALVDARSARQLENLARRLRLLGTLPVLLASTVSSAVPASVTGGLVTLYKPVRLSRLLAALRQALDPLTEDTPAAPAAPADHGGPGPQPLRGLRVLLADDNPINQLVASSMLEQLGAGVQAVDSGQAALQALAAGRFDIVLLDCEMPDIDGCEVTRRWRAVESREGREPTPMVAVTGHSRQDAWPRCEAAGMDDFLSKPYFSEHLCDLVLRQTERARANP